MSEISRRQFARDTLGTLLTMSLLETVFQNELLGADVRPAAAQWLRDIEQMGQDLKGQKLEQLVWQQKVEELFKQVPLADILGADRFRSTLERREVRRQRRAEPAIQVPRSRRGAEEPGVRPADLRAQERSLGRAARPQQHGHGVPDSERGPARPALRPPQGRARALYHSADGRSHIRAGGNARRCRTSRTMCTGSRPSPSRPLSSTCMCCR